MNDRKELTAKIIDEQKPLHQVFQFSKQDMNSIYSVGHSLYQQGKHKDAEDVFLNLLLMEWSNKEYAEALAIVRKEQGKWFAAQMAYKHLAIIDHSNDAQYQKEIEALQGRMN